jgi:hypothetical protein
VRYELTRIRALREIGDSLRSHVKEVIVGSQETRWRALQTCAPKAQRERSLRLRCTMGLTPHAAPSRTSS